MQLDSGSIAFSELILGSWYQTEPPSWSQTEPRSHTKALNYSEVGSDPTLQWTFTWPGLNPDLYKPILLYLPSLTLHA